MRKMVILIGGVVLIAVIIAVVASVAGAVAGVVDEESEDQENWNTTLEK